MNWLHSLMMELGFPLDLIEWKIFRHSDGRWYWEYGRNNEILRRCGGGFWTKEQCLQDAADHGFSRTFSNYSIVDMSDGERAES